MNTIVVSFFLIMGAIFILIASIGLLRYGDIFSRMHATTKATSFGILLLLIGVSLYFNSWNVFVKSAFIVIFIYLTAPLAAHSIAKSFKDTSENNEIQQ